MAVKGEATVGASKVLFDLLEFIKNFPEWENVDAYWSAAEHVKPIA